MSKPVSFKRQLRIFLLKWHRSIGLFAAIFVLILVGSGIALNHGNEWGIDHAPLPVSLLGLYGVDVEVPVKGYQVENHWIAETGEQLYIDGQPRGVCESPLAGAVRMGEGDELEIAALCQNGLAFYTAEGELIEKAGENPDLMFRMARPTSQGELLAQGKEAEYLFNIDSFEWDRLAADSQQPQWLVPETMPARVVEVIESNFAVAEITWERFMLDLHSGRILGSAGVWFVDFMALCIGILAISGVWLRLSRPGRSS